MEVSTDPLARTLQFSRAPPNAEPIFSSLFETSVVGLQKSERAILRRRNETAGGDSLDLL